MTGSVEKQIGVELWQGSLIDLVASLKPVVLAKYQWLEQSIA